MTRPQRYLRHMTFFVVGAAAVTILLYEPLLNAFLANPVFNGLIAAVLLFGIAFVFRQVTQLRPEIDWITAYRRGKDSLPPPARLLAPTAALLGDQEGGRVRLSTMSMRSLLDGVASRLDEGREISRYLIGLLIFLGLLGTFWGLLMAIGAISDTIRGLSVDTADIALMFGDLKQGLEAPLSGMGTAFSSSLFGLAGSVMLGFLDLQAGQAQNRFYNDLEDWLSSVTTLSRGSAGSAEGEEGVSGAYIGALLEQSADSLDELQRAINRSEENRSEITGAIVSLTEGLATLTDQMRAQQTLMTKLVESQGDVRRALERMADTTEMAGGGLNDAAVEHLRNLDVGLKRLVEEQTKSRGVLINEVRSELKLLARTLASTLGNKKPQPVRTRKPAMAGTDEP